MSERLPSVNERTNKLTRGGDRGEGGGGGREGQRRGVAPGPGEEFVARDTKKRASGTAVVIY